MKLPFKKEVNTKEAKQKSVAIDPNEIEKEEINEEVSEETLTIAEAINGIQNAIKDLYLRQEAVEAFMFRHRGI